MPPEALRLQPVYSEKLDTFSFGVLIIQIQTRRFPNPEAHEVLIADASSPTGFVSMPVKEADRRDKDISLVSDNQLKAVALHCIEDIATQRPSSSELCDKLEDIKCTAEYIDSKNSTPALQAEQNRGVVETGNDSKDKEIEMLRIKVQRYQELVERQTKESQSTSVANAVLPSKNDSESSSDETSETLPSALSPESSKTSSISGSPKKVINNLNVDTVTLLSKSDVGSIAGVIYNQPRPGSITAMANSRAQLDALVQQLMAAYQKMASTPSQLSFVAIPDECPIEEVESIIKEYDMVFKPCSFLYVKDINAIQVVSTNFGLLGKVTDQLKNNFKHTMYFSGGRKLTLVKGDITKENVSVLVTATNRLMNPSNGMCKAVNIASKGKIEGYCREAIHNRGGRPLEECEIVTTPAGGDLKCRWVMHALGPDGARHSSKDCQDMTRTLIEDCLTKGNELKATSIALPAISTGHHHVKTKVAANGIITAVMNYDFYDYHTLRDIRIVIIDDRTFNEFVEVFEDRLVDLYGQNEASGSYDAATPLSYLPGGCKTQ